MSVTTSMLAAATVDGISPAHPRLAMHGKACSSVAAGLACNSPISSAKKCSESVLPSIDWQHHQDDHGVVDGVCRKFSIRPHEHIRGAGIQRLTVT